MSAFGSESLSFSSCVDSTNVISQDMLCGNCVLSLSQQSACKCHKFAPANREMFKTFVSQDFQSCGFDITRKSGVEGKGLVSLAFIGRSLSEYTLCVSDRFSSFVSEQSDLDNVDFTSQDLADKVLGYIPTKFLDQIDDLVRMCSIASERSFSSVISKKNALMLAELSSSFVISFKLLSHEFTSFNLVCCITSVISKLKLPEDKINMIITFVKDAVKYLMASLNSYRGYISQSASDIKTSLLSFLEGSWSLLNDDVINICTTFMIKVAAFWASISGGFLVEDFKLSEIPDLVSKVKETFKEGIDILQGVCALYSWITENFPKFFKGDFDGLFFGKAETGLFESRVAKVNKLYTLVKSGSEDILRNDYEFTFARFDSEVSQLIKIGERMLAKAKVAQRPAYKRMLEELRTIDIDRKLAHAEVQTKIPAVGICFVGPSGVGKSVIMDQTSKTIIRAYGENVVSNDMVITGSLSDKFDSNELPQHLSIQYDDVANNSENEIYDKLLNALNSQARPFLKASVEEKGKMFPGNVACVISTNVPGINAKKKSKCPDSICRRFLHINVSLKEGLDIYEPGTKRIDPSKACKNGQKRMDIWKFDVYQFITFDSEEIDAIAMGEIGAVLWHEMWVTPQEWTSKPIEDQTFWDLATYLGKRAKAHFDSQRIMINSLKDEQVCDYCEDCYCPINICSCGFEGQFVDEIQRRATQTIVDTYMTFQNWFSDFTNFGKLTMVAALVARRSKNNLKQAMLTSGLFFPFLVYTLFYSKCLIFLVVCVFSFGAIFATMTYLQYRQAERDVARVPNVITHLAEDSIEIIHRYRNEIFSGSVAILFCYGILKYLRPKSQYLSYREQLSETVVAEFKRAEAARTTPVDQIMPHIRKDIGILTVEVSGNKNRCLCFPMKGNMFLTVGHILPNEGEFIVEVTHESGYTPTVAKQKISNNFIYRFPGKDLALFYVPSAVPRKGYTEFLLGEEAPFKDRPIRFVTRDLFTNTSYVYSGIISPAWSMLSSSVSTDRVKLTRPYKYDLPVATSNGMCTSVIVDFEKSIIYGFHVAGKGKTGLCSVLSASDVKKAIDSFTSFIPHDAGELMMGNNVISNGLGFIEYEDKDESVNKPINDHNLLAFGVLAGASATFKCPYVKSPFLKEIVEEFGPALHGPPQGINDDFHKRKALTKLSTPNQEFSLDEVKFVVDDYKIPILSLIESMDLKDEVSFSEPLTLQQALDGIGESGLGGLDNTTSCGFPFKGKKKDFLVRDYFDPNIPLTPRVLREYNGVNIIDVMEKMRETYLTGKSCMPLFKCSMKSNELLPINKYKARVFMGCNFPFLLLCRQYFAPFIRLLARNQYLFEAAVGINMDSIEAERLCNHLRYEDENRIVALDYSAYDQTMASQVSTAASGIIIDILAALGCSKDHLMIARGLLTDINYPVLHYFGTIFRLANSNPSGQPITTQLNGIVNSLYLRIFFYRIYPNLKNKVQYRDAVKTMTYGDDNINGVGIKYDKFNGESIVAAGAQVGLGITMADKGAEIFKFTNLYESGFLKRNFRFDEDIGHIVAPLDKSSITKSIHWFKKDDPDGVNGAFVKTAMNMMRASRNHGRQYFEEIKQKLQNVAVKNGTYEIIRWFDYDTLSKDFKRDYYTNFKAGSSLFDDFESQDACDGFISQSFVIAPTTQVLGVSVMLALKITLVCLWVYIIKFIVDTYFTTYRTVVSTTKIVSDKFVSILSPYNIYVILGDMEQKSTYAKAGRLSELNMSMDEFRLELDSWISYYKFFLEVPFLNHFYLRSIGHLYNRLVSLKTEISLFVETELIREAPFGILLSGLPGCGKSAAAIALIKDLFDLVGGIEISDIVVLNEDDEFQSEFKTNHRAVVLDDLCQTNPMVVTSSPLRRVIDFINNIPKRALNPHLELKGQVKIAPEIVVATSNLALINANSYCVSKDAIYRRFVRLWVYKKSDYKFDNSKLDVLGWRFILCDDSAEFSCKQYDEQELSKLSSLSYPELLSILSSKFLEHRSDQRCFVKNVNQYFSQGLSHDQALAQLTRELDIKSRCSQRMTDEQLVEWLADRMMTLRGNQSEEEPVVEVEPPLSIFQRIYKWISDFMGWGFISQAFEMSPDTHMKYADLVSRLPSNCCIDRKEKCYVLDDCLVLSPCRGSFVYYIFSDLGLKKALEFKQLFSGHTDFNELRYHYSTYWCDAVVKDSSSLEITSNRIISDYECVVEKALFDVVIDRLPSAIEIVAYEWSIYGKTHEGKGDLILRHTLQDIYLIVEVKKDSPKKTLSQVFKSARMFSSCVQLRNCVLLIYIPTYGLCFVASKSCGMNSHKLSKLLDSVKANYRMDSDKISHPLSIAAPLSLLTVEERSF
jgi:hypothetical protein